MDSFHVTILIVSLTVIAIGTSEAAYGRINDYLIKNVNDDEIVSNMNAAVQWLDKQAGSKTLFMNSNNDFKKFATLQQIIDDTKCDGAAYKIIRANEEAVGLHRLNDRRMVIRRVDKVMLKIFEKHAERCLKVYPVTYAEKKRELDETVLKYVRQIEKSMRGTEWDIVTHRRSYFVANPENLFSRYVRDIPTIEDVTGNLYDALVKISKDDPDAKYLQKVPDEQKGKLVIHKDKVKELVKKYLIDPCRQFEDVMGPDLFIPARFDARVYNSIDDDNVNYYFGWSYFMICQILTSNQAAVTKDVIKSVY